MRYINLTKEQEERIRDLYKNNLKKHIIERAQALLLSNKGFSRKDISRILEKRLDTISDWYNRIEQDPNWNLEDNPRSGRKPKLDEAKQKSLFFCEGKGMS